MDLEAAQNEAQKRMDAARDDYHFWRGYLARINDEIILQQAAISDGGSEDGGSDVPADSSKEKDEPTA